MTTSDKRVYLKVKVKSLTEEARIIRKEEIKLKNYSRFLMRGEATDYEKAVISERWYGLQRHRRIELRQEARSTYIAYGFIRGKAYYDIEPRNTTKKVNWDSVKAMVKKYGSLEGFEQWLKEKEPVNE